MHDDWVKSRHQWRNAAFHHMPGSNGEYLLALNKIYSPEAHQLHVDRLMQIPSECHE
jgi:hypothetical protein